MPPGRHFVGYARGDESLDASDVGYYGAVGGDLRGGERQVGDKGDGSGHHDKIRAFGGLTRVGEAAVNRAGGKGLFEGGLSSGGSAHLAEEGALLYGQTDGAADKADTNYRD
jgi:hypothetical protein